MSHSIKETVFLLLFLIGMPCANGALQPKSQKKSEESQVTDFATNRLLQGRRRKDGRDLDFLGRIPAAVWRQYVAPYLSVPHNFFPLVCEPRPTTYYQGKLIHSFVAYEMTETAVLGEGCLYFLFEREQKLHFMRIRSNGTHEPVVSLTKNALAAALSESGSKLELRPCHWAVTELQQGYRSLFIAYWDKKSFACVIQVRFDERDASKTSYQMIWSKEYSSLRRAPSLRWHGYDLLEIHGGGDYGLYEIPSTNTQARCLLHNGSAQELISFTVDRSRRLLLPNGRFLEGPKLFVLSTVHNQDATTKVTCTVHSIDGLKNHAIPEGQVEHTLATKLWSDKWENPWDDYDRRVIQGNSFLLKTHSRGEYALSSNAFLNANNNKMIDSLEAGGEKKSSYDRKYGLRLWEAGQAGIPVRIYSLGERPGIRVNCFGQIVNATALLNVVQKVDDPAQPNLFFIMPFPDFLPAHASADGRLYCKFFSFRERNVFGICSWGVSKELADQIPAQDILPVKQILAKYHRNISAEEISQKDLQEVSLVTRKNLERYFRGNWSTTAAVIVDEEQQRQKAKKRIQAVGCLFGGLMVVGSYRLFKKWKAKQKLPALRTLVKQ